MSDNDVDEDRLLREAQRNDEIRRRDMIQAVDFGLGVQKFLDGPIGRKILDDAEAELKDIADTMFTLDPFDDNERVQLHKLRFRAGILQHWQDCFAQYIIAGQNAEKQMKFEEES